MTDFQNRLREELADQMDPGSIARINDAALTGARRVVRRRRIGAGTGAALTLALATTVAMNLPGTASGGPEGQVAPAGRVASTGSPDPTAMPTDPGYSPSPTPTPTPHVPPTVPPGSFPEIAVDPASGPYQDMRGPSTGSVYAKTVAGPMNLAGCDENFGVGTLDAEMGSMADYAHESMVPGTADGDMDPAIVRQVATVTANRFAAGSGDLISAFLERKMPCVPMSSAFTTVTPPTVPGADRVWMARSTAPDELYGNKTTYVMVQQGRYLLSVTSMARTQELADGQATWFAQQSLARLQAGIR